MKKTKGILFHKLLPPSGEESLFTFFENWKSMEDLEKHPETPHLKAFIQRAGSLLAKPIEVSLFEMISEA